jgi:hypothetical protein
VCVATAMRVIGTTGDVFHQDSARVGHSRNTPITHCYCSGPTALSLPICATARRAHAQLRTRRASCSQIPLWPGSEYAFWGGAQAPLSSVHARLRPALGT